MLVKFTAEVSLNERAKKIYVVRVCCLCLADRPRVRNRKPVNLNAILRSDTLRHPRRRCPCLGCVARSSLLAKVMKFQSKWLPPSNKNRSQSPSLDSITTKRSGNICKHFKVESQFFFDATFTGSDFEKIFFSFNQKTMPYKFALIKSFQLCTFFATHKLG